MYIFLFSTLIYLASGASTGAASCDALGVCAEPGSGAYLPPEHEGLDYNSRPRILHSGCGTALDVLQIVLDGNNETHLHRTFCCDATPGNATGCWSPSTLDVRKVNGTEFCNEDRTLSQATRYCKEQGLRLCTVPEIQEGLCCQQSCGVFNRYVWTSTTLGNPQFQDDPDALDFEGYLYKCPKGMHKVGTPTRSMDYAVTSSSSEYRPGELLSITVKSLNPFKKFLGIMMYAVQNDGVIGVKGGGGPNCAAPGCSGYSENKVGEWVLPEGEEDFRIGCTKAVLTHQHAQLKRYTQTFQWRAPEKGTGDVIFRVIVKQGSTNGGFFYWPMNEDLMIMEASEPVAQWFTGSLSKSCNQICSDNHRNCREDIPHTLALYDEMSTEHACKLPLISTCDPQFPTQDADGRCWIHNKQSTQCDTLRNYVSCCNNDGSGFENACQGLKTLPEAKEICSAKGKRLCAASEMQCEDTCKDKGRLMWTNDDGLECVDPAQKLCDGCLCEWSVGQDTGRSDADPFICMLWAAEGDYTWYAVRGGALAPYCMRRPAETCYESGNLVNANADWSIWFMNNAPATKHCDNCKCSGVTTGTAITVEHGLECHTETLSRGLLWFTFDDATNKCEPKAAADCAEAARDTETSNTWGIYEITDYNCTDKVVLADSCSGHTYKIENKPVPPATTAAPDAQNICELKTQAGGDTRVCRCSDNDDFGDPSSDSTILMIFLIVACVLGLCCVVIMCVGDFGMNCCIPENRHVTKDHEMGIQHFGETSNVTHYTKQQPPPSPGTKYGGGNIGGGLPTIKRNPESSSTNTFKL